MSVAPDDWREYQWRALSGFGAGAIGENWDRHWRITVTVTGPAPTLTWAATGLVLTFSPGALQPYVLEPRGMTFGSLIFADCDVLLEAITRS